jgi:hypothetical protein
MRTRFGVLIRRGTGRHGTGRAPVRSIIERQPIAPNRPWPDKECRALRFRHPHFPRLITAIACSIADAWQVQAEAFRRMEPNCPRTVRAEAEAIRYDIVIFAQRNKAGTGIRAKIISPSISLTSKLAS